MRSENHHMIFASYLIKIKFLRSMLNRRHIRIKVMQTLYAMQQTQSDRMDTNENFLFQSIENIRNLYLMMLSSLIEMQKNEQEFLELSAQKHLATSEERNPNRKFIDNKVLHILVHSEKLNDWLENEKINQFQLNDQYIKQLLTALKENDLYKNYMSSGIASFEEDREFVLQLFTEIIAPNDKIYDFIEDSKLTWVDDIPVVNTFIQKQLRQLKSETDYFRVPKLYKDEDDKEFARQLYRKTALNADDLEKAYHDKTRNWDIERIAEIDGIILNMAVCELQKFPSIPVKVTINEYLEIAKEYSTPKSSIFINGILDVLVKEYKQNNTLNKVGRGLME